MSEQGPVDSQFVLYCEVDSLVINSKDKSSNCRRCGKPLELIGEYTLLVRETGLDAVREEETTAVEPDEG